MRNSSASNLSVSMLASKVSLQAVISSSFDLATFFSSRMKYKYLIWQSIKRQQICQKTAEVWSKHWLHVNSPWGMPVQYCGGCPIIMVSRTVLIVSHWRTEYHPRTEGIPQSTDGNPPQYWWYPFTELIVTYHFTYSLLAQCWTLSKLQYAFPILQIIPLLPKHPPQDWGYSLTVLMAASHRPEHSLSTASAPRPLPHH